MFFIFEYYFIRTKTTNMSVLEDSINSLPINDEGIVFNQPMLTHSNIGYIKLPKIHRVKFTPEESGDFRNDKPIDVKSITPESIKSITNPKELKKIANSIAMYDTKGGNTELKRKILERIELIKEYKTI